ncbi:hypothetical protein ACB092_09G195200 [Castanea dentata]
MAKSGHAGKSPSIISTIMLVLGLLMAILGTTVATIGICYGMLGDNFPSPGEVINMYKQNNIGRMRLYCQNYDAFQALRGTNIELMLDVKFKYIAIDNEIEPNGPYAQFLYPAMEHIQTAIYNADLGYKNIKVSTPIYQAALAKSYPPSKGSFTFEYRSFLDPIIGFLVNHKYPLLVNMYPYYSYIENTKDIRLEYALFTSPSVVVQDGEHGYQNIIDTILDAFYSALEKANGGSLDIVVSETGWPSNGGQATYFEYASLYNKNLIKHVQGGTPKRPIGPIETYMFAMFNENKKTPDYEKYWGLFYPIKQPKYQIKFS